MVYYGKGRDMKIELIKHTFDGGDVGYKCRLIKYCCDKLKNNPVIDLVHEYTVGDYTEDLFPSVSIWHGEDWEEWGEEYHTDTYYKINYCPFCNKPIEISVVEEIDLSELFAEFKEQRSKTNKERLKTDSKKEEHKLNKVVHELDDKIDWFYQLYEWDGSIDSIGKVGE